MVVLSQFVDPEYALAFLEGAAARRVLLKERVGDVASSKRDPRGRRGGSVIDVKVVETLVAARSQRDASPLDKLTPRERQTLEEMARARRTPPSRPRDH